MNQINMAREKAYNLIGGAMTRIISEFPKKETEVSDFHPGSKAEEYPIQIITPIFGGGTEPGENDLEMLIRPSSIRGHLRFWWRATRGAKFENVSQLFDRESEVWGTPDNPSPVTIQVSQPSSGSIKQRKSSDDYGFRSRYGPESYVLFPAREKASSLCKEGISFLLKVYWPKHERLQYLRNKENEKLRMEKRSKAEKIEDIGPDIETAIWAWTNFGGIGSRTRRGCGALYCKKTAPQDTESVGKWYSDHLNSDSFGKQPQRAWPTLPAKILIGASKGKPMDEWANVIDIMRSFRQGAGIGRNPGNSSNPRMPGRSFWPEPETIRKITGDRLLPKHQRLKDIPDDFFPRAELGLPIVFHFKNGRKKDDHETDVRDPPESELCPTGYKRMSSPIILRPIAFGDGSRAVPLIIRLNTEPLSQVELKVGGSTKGTFGPSVIRNLKLAAYRNSPMSGLTGTGSALEAFVAFAGMNGFKEVGF